MNLPLMSSWTLHADALPERMLDAQAQPRAFRLPGADALSEFAGLLGFDEADPAPMDGGQDDAPCAPFPLPALFEPDVCGPVSLETDVDLSAHAGDAAALIFDSVCGAGEVMLTICPRPGEAAEAPERIASFAGGPLHIDLTQALARRRRCRIALRFDETRPAGVSGAVMLRVTAFAALGGISVRPQRALHTMTFKADVTAVRAGDYLLRAAVLPPAAPDCEENAPPVREMTLSLSAGESKRVSMAMEAHADAFAPGKPYAAPALKLWLHRALPSGKPGALCDTRTMMTGFPGEAPGAYLPLCKEEAHLPPEALIERLRALHIHAVSLPVPAPDVLCRELTRAGIALRQTAETPPEARERLLRWPCVAFDEAFAHSIVDNGDPVLSAWQLCGLVTYPRTADPDMTPADMLRDAAGRPIDETDAGAADVLAWLRAVSVRLRAEAIRQGRLTGAYCAPGEWATPDVAQALETALAPMHLSALPLCGAWWTGSRFSASLCAFIPEGENRASLRAQAVLEDAQGNALARAEFPCDGRRAAPVLLEAALPDHACVLDLTARILDGDTVAEESVLPVYVGERGPLEAAF